MRKVIHAILALALSLALAGTAMPLRASVAQPATTSCCARMNLAEQQQTDCMKHLPKSAQDQLCCAACPFGLAILPGSAPAVLAPPAGEDSFTVWNPDLHGRCERPPVPPPRSSAA